MSLDMHSMNLDMHSRLILGMVGSCAVALEDELEADVVFYHGDIDSSTIQFFRDYIEDVKHLSDRTEGAIAVFLRTGGGSVETTEGMVTILRKHYQQVYFVVPDMAMSAGTILCMSGDKIYMDYASSLGPIDPQVFDENLQQYVPALGCLDKVEEITQKGNLAPADVIFLKGLTLEQLRLYEQARDLSTELLKEWLVEYKFKSWTHHRTHNVGTPVTQGEKEKRAEEIATALASNKIWHAHGRRLDIQKLKVLGIEIDDYSQNDTLRKLIREYNDALTSWIDSKGILSLGLS